MPQEGVEPRTGALEVFSMQGEVVLLARKRMRPVSEEQVVEAAERVLVPLEPPPLIVSVQ